MPRPPLEVGKHGNIATSSNSRHFTARARVRFFDDEVRQVSASGATERAAQAALKRKIKKLLLDDSSPITARTPVREVAEMWHRDKKNAGLAYRTLERQRDILDRFVLKRIGSLPVGDATTGRLDRLVKDVEQSAGGDTAKMVKSALNGIFGLATRYDAINHNPVLGVETPKTRRAPVRALSPEEYKQVRGIVADYCRPLTVEERRARAHSRHVHGTGGANKSAVILDVMDFIIGTGVRSSEALAVTWDRIILDAPPRYVRIDRTVIRRKGEGLVIQEWTKTHDVRLLTLPAPVVDMLTARRGLSADGSGPVFTSTRGTLIDPSNMRKHLREALDGTPYAWVTQKTLRKSVATALNLDGGSQFAAAQLGHASDSVTRQFYIERSRSPHDARSSLAAFFEGTTHKAPPL